ncbi:DUF6318 family protein [Micrococcus terreus]|uniref:DUF6318 family protein n=1 Tax=Micrococcus terreus TaxID=574650 RepID=UPI002953291F|nr:DUF6318 family protein [Micrococcus terreus]MDK7701016.1 DUF6318 family protein [Micrococcus terreus]WOO96776.1 DUF6318 family protein [Micrococcus terreus]
MRRPNRLTMPLALSAAAALLLTGCTGGGDGGDESPSPTAGQSTSAPVSESPGGGSESATPTESATPEPATSTSAAKNIPAPEMPDAMKKNDQAGLEAALEYWWQAAHYLQQTGDSRPLESVSSPKCQLCSYLADNWAVIYDAGGWAEAGPAAVDVELATIEDSGARGTLLFNATEDEVVVRDSTGAIDKETSSEAIADVPWTASSSFSEDVGHWRIDDILVSGSAQ